MNIRTLAIIAVLFTAVVLYLDNPGNGRQFHSEETDKIDEEYVPDPEPEELEFEYEEENEMG